MQLGIGAGMLFGERLESVARRRDVLEGFQWALCRGASLRHPLIVTPPIDARQSPDATDSELSAGNLTLPAARAYRANFGGTAVSRAMSALLFPLNRDVPTTTVSPRSIVKLVFMIDRSPNFGAARPSRERFSPST